MHRIATVLLGLLLVAGSAIADVRLITKRLANGMIVVLAPDVPSETLAIHLTFDAGSRLDRGTRHGTAWLANRIVGARLPEFTTDVNQERSVFAATVAATKLPETLTRIRQALDDQPLPEGAFASTRDWAVAEARKSAEKSAAEELLLRLVYDARPHGHRAAAAPTNVRRSDVQRFLTANYEPAAAVIAIAGTFDADAVMASVDATVASLRTRERKRPRCEPALVRLRKERAGHIASKATQPVEIHLGYPTAPAPTADWYALNILADILGQGAASRLQARLVGQGLATHFGEGETESPCSASLLRMRVRVAPGVAIATVMAAFDEELDRLRGELVSDAELVTAKEQERRWAAEQLSTPAGVAGAGARAALFYGDAGRANTDVALMAAVSADDVRRVARTYLQQANRAIVIVAPPR